MGRPSWLASFLGDPDAIFFRNLLARRSALRPTGFAPTGVRELIHQGVGAK